MTGSEASKNREPGKTSLFGHLWVMLYAFLMFMFVRNIAMYAVNFLILELFGKADTALSRFFFTRNMSGELDGITGNAQVLMSAAGFLCGIIPIFSMAKRFIGESRADYEKSGKAKRHELDYGILSLLDIGAVLFLNISFELTHITDRYRTYMEGKTDPYSANIVIGLICYGIISPAAEELLFRGIIFNYLKRIMKLQWVIILSAALFGLYHMNAVQGAYAFIMGLLFGYFYEYFGDFAVPVLLHMISNVTAYLMSYTKIGASTLDSVTVAAVSALVFALGMFYFVNKSKKEEKKL